MPVEAVRITELSPTQVRIERLSVMSWQPLTYHIEESSVLDHSNIDLEAYVKEHYLCSES